MLHQQNEEYSNITKKINFLKELSAEPECEDILEKKEELKTHTLSLNLLKKTFTATQVLLVSIHLSNFLISLPQFITVPLRIICMLFTWSV